ncbi:MAG: hypothetical protein FI737_01310 [SAR202 cluster bacterium]|nr:hypothetical protein [Dehalococcoidia bacterium]MQF87717.1 hypothetical protein [SAR202 cluster bacterium]
MRSAVASQALMVRPESEHSCPSSLANKPIAVQFHAGSHYTVLRLLEGYIPAGKINLLHYGRPRYRFEAMMSGEVDAAINRAVIRAVDLINSDKKRFIHYPIDQPKFAPVAKVWGGLTADDFHLPCLRYAHPRPYTKEQLEDTYNWMVRWDLLNAAVCATDYVDNRAVDSIAADETLFTV